MVGTHGKQIMGSQKEFEGRSVEGALKKASREFDVAAEELTYDIIKEGASGIFGLVGAKKAKISVTLPQSDKNDSPSTDLIPENDTPEKVDFTPPEISESDTVEAALEQSNIFLTTLAENITQEIFIESTITPKKLKINLGGTNPAMLIGRRGETLEALQYLTEKVVNKKLSGRMRVQLDVEGYMQNRRTNIRNLSLRLAEKARLRGRPVTVGQMPPNERRLVHVTLRDAPGVRTQSIGAGFIRKIMIFPENGQNHRRRKSRPRRSG